jgi:PKD repeat protein
MALLPLVGPSYNLDSRPASVQRTVNLMPVPIEPGNERISWALKDVPGLVEFEVCIVPSFSVAAEPEEGAPPLEVQFTLTELAGTGPFTFLWDFGDVETSTQQNPLHTYEEAGNYEVSVTITNACGVQTIEVEVLVEERETIAFTQGDDLAPLLPESAQTGDAALMYIAARSSATITLDNPTAWGFVAKAPVSAGGVQAVSLYTRLLDGTADDEDTGFTVSQPGSAWAMATIAAPNDAAFPDGLTEPVDYNRQTVFNVGGVNKAANTTHVALVAGMMTTLNAQDGQMTAPPSGYTSIGEPVIYTFSDVNDVFCTTIFAYRLFTAQTEDPGAFSQSGAYYAEGSFIVAVAYTP